MQTDNRGTATTKVPVFGSVLVAFDHDPATQVIYQEMREKRGAVPGSSCLSCLSLG